MWFLHNKVPLTNYNLAKRNWQGNRRCYFCNQDKIIQHLFILYPFEKNVWLIVYMALNITPPTNTNFCLAIGWRGLQKKIKYKSDRVGFFALLWTIWRTQK
jgi:biotin synthase-like enzyme